MVLRQIRDAHIDGGAANMVLAAFGANNPATLQGKRKGAYIRACP